MADPVPIITGIITIASAAAQISKAISHLRRLGQVPGQIYALRNEITDLEVVLRQTGSALQEKTLSLDGQYGSLHDMSLRAKSDLTELSRTLERIASAVEQSNAKLISRTAVWLREKQHLHKLQISIQTVKEALSFILGASNARNLHHARLELREVAILNTRSRQLQETHSRQVTQNLHSHQIMLESRLNQHQQDLSDRLDLLEQLILKQGQGDEPPKYTDESFTLDEKGKSSSTELESLRIVVSQPAPCRSWCPCACHAKRKVNVTDDGVVGRLLGKMFIGYAGIPLLNHKCDFRGCTHQRAPSVEMEYWFPWWFVATNIKLGFTDFGNTGPQFQLTTSRRVSDTAPVISCVMQKDIEGLKYLFSNGLASVRDVSASRGFTLMRWALYGEWRCDVVQFLISQGASIDDESYDNVYDFMYRGQITEKEQQGLRCITSDTRRNWIEDQNFPLVHRIILGLSSKSLEVELQENPFAIYVTDALGRTALDWASARAQTADVALLLSNGCDPNTMDFSGRSAILHCVDNASILCLDLLLKAGAHPNPKLPKGVYRSSPLAAAASGGKRDVLRVLLEYDADANIATPEGLTPLHLVARSRDAACALILLEHGADLNALSRDGRSPLTTAIAHNNHEVLQLFVSRCYEYITSAHLRGPQLLPIIAEFADRETMSILACSHPLKLSYNLSNEVVAESLAMLQERQDYNEKLSAAFEELISIAQAKTPATGSTESFMEAGLFISAKSSFCSDLTEAMEILNSPTSPIDEVEKKVVDLQIA